MIFKSLHESLVKKKINKSLELLNEQIRIKPNPIKTIGCIIDPLFPVEVNNFIKLVNKIGLKEKDLKLITFQENENGFNIFSNMNVTPKSISFTGNLTGKDSLEFISYDYDLLINFFKSNNVLTLLSSKVNAKFRVGFSSVDSRLNDLMFSDKINKFKEFDSELIKYLRIIK
ncbi:MAG: hypothetical protein EVA39_02110 [Flavobacteriales bacterium]|jgi:hypothetical protein|nr:hypothetical protein [Flavobacteriaceae bacterium]RZP09063.1 MAG: hypothetical protein EVA39_02110 [Flavobacteriales bacterium]|tara:strand:+ start:769 stop:1284 length:516 start_codon:yes stop_codon:yes gene_type:complete